MPPLRRIDVVLDSVKRLQRIGATANLLNLLQKQHPADLAKVFSNLPDREKRSVFDTLFERKTPEDVGALLDAYLIGDESTSEEADSTTTPPSTDTVSSVDAAFNELMGA